MSLNSTRIEINTTAFINNIKILTKKIKDKKVCLVVKSNAYGHGIVEIAKIAEKNNINILAVSNISEGIALRKAGIESDILILTPFIKSELPFLYQFYLTPMLTHLEYVSELCRLSNFYGFKLPVHIKINTGMNRSGFSIESIQNSIQTLLDSQAVDIKGIASHFASADNKNQESYLQTKNQLDRFQYTIDKIKNILHPNILIHTANTSAVMNYPESYFNMVRVGLGAYGYPYQEHLGLRPVLTLKTKVVHSYKIKKGEKVSYGAIWEAQQDTYIAILPIGYGDGYPRALSNIGKVKIHQEYFSIIGRICMNVMIIDTQNKKIPIGEDVLLIGDDPLLNAECIASQIDTISYELLTSIDSNIPKIYK